MLFPPNLFCNSDDAFATLAQTAENATLSGPLFNPIELIEFWSSQIAVFGPVGIVVLVITLFNLKALPPFGRWIAGLALLPLMAISLEALLSRANANWAATAYIAAPIIVSLYAMSRPATLKGLKYGLIAQGPITVCFGIMVLVPNWANNFEPLANSGKPHR